MKKNMLIFFIFSVLVSFLFGCGASVSNETEEGGLISKIEIQFKDKIVECSDKEQINEITSMFEEETLSLTENEEGKGWIYKITYHNENGDTIKTLIISNENTVKIDDTIYECNTISLDKLDDISGIDRK